VDVQQFNLTPYKLFFPEKRPFFLENDGVFAFPMGISSSDQLFFSRQIGIDPTTGQQVPINGGAKVTGSIGGLELGVMDVDTRHSGPNPWANYAVARVKKSLWGSGSYVGVMGIDKRSGEVGSNFNQALGADARFVLFNNLVLGGYAAQSRTPGLSGGQSNLGASLNFHSNWLELEADHRKIGPNFNPAVGFLERTDCICDYVDAIFKLRPKLTGYGRCNSRVFFPMIQILITSFKRRSGKILFESSSIMVPIPTTTSSTHSRKGSSRLSISTRMSIYRWVSIAGKGTS
jgi:hypothetical protein